MKGTYLRLSIVILTCVTIVIVLCRESLFITDKDKFILEEMYGNKVLGAIDLEKTGPDVVVPEKVEDDIIRFIDLKGFYTPGIESLDVSNVKELKSFTLHIDNTFSQSNLKRLDFSKNKKLKYISVINAKALNEIVFSESCETISISNTAVKEVDLKELKKLDSFAYRDGPLEELDVSNNPDLKEIWIVNAQIKDIDISNNPNLQRLKVVNTNVKVIDVSNNPILEYIEVNEGVQIIGNTNASIIYVDEELAKRIKED